MDEVDSRFEYYQRTVDERDESLLKLSIVLIDFKDNAKEPLFYTGFPN